jgi:hypothetical protein
MSADESRYQATRCLQIAEETPSAKLKGVLIAHAKAWNRLAEEQERIERRAADRRAHEGVWRWPDESPARRARS